MSQGWIAAGLIGCLLGMLALLPPFDGKWDR
jgi:hypothetical protein